MNTIFRNIALISLFFSFQLFSFAQADKTMMLCNKHLQPPFVSDGQEYRALLNGSEIAEFNVTFYGGSTYRIIACSGIEEGKLIFSIYDRENTVNLSIEAELEQNEGNSGFAFIQIGFKQ